MAAHCRGSAEKAPGDPRSRPGATAVGLDVYWDEPPDPDDPIFDHNVLATPQIAASTDVSMRGIVEVVAENIRRVARGQEPLQQREG